MRAYVVVNMADSKVHGLFSSESVAIMKINRLIDEDPRTYMIPFGDLRIFHDGEEVVPERSLTPLSQGGGNIAAPAFSSEATHDDRTCGTR